MVLAAGVLGAGALGVGALATGALAGGGRFTGAGVRLGAGVGAGVGGGGEVTPTVGRAPSAGGSLRVFSSSWSTSWAKSSNSRMRTKSMAPASELSTTRQAQSTPFTATPTGSPRGISPPSPEVTIRSPAFTGS